MSIAVVVVAYNRPFCTRRLLDQLNKAEYEGDCVDLIISIDKSECVEVEQLASSFNWKHGKKEVRKHEVNLGLRRHILECGDITKEYDAIILFEDDILPSLYFYLYSKAAINRYKDDIKIAGISLYQHQWNVGNSTAFIPDSDPNFDNFFMQYAQSWGQVWTTRMWNEYMCWYQKNMLFEKTSDLPNNVNHWPESSWLKYQIKYVVENDKYFVYPKHALSTNCGDAGTHNISSPHYQVPLLNCRPESFKLSRFKDSNLIYDAFFERIEIANHLHISLDDLCIDLNGLKGNTKQRRYWLTLDQRKYKIIKKYGLCLKPIELNVLLEIEGNDIYLYDTLTNENNEFNKEDIKWKRLNYSNRDIRVEHLYLMAYKRTIGSVKAKFSKILKLMRKKHVK